MASEATLLAEMVEILLLQWDYAVLVWVQHDDEVCMSVGYGTMLLHLAYSANLELEPILPVEVG